MARNSVIILPSSATELNRLMAATEVARSDGIEEFISLMWNPYECPVEFLPYLAWALSVDVYDDEWPEVIKRNVIAASPLVHRRKGTVDAVVRVLAALGTNVVVDEWHLQEPIGRRGTFKVSTFHEDETLSDFQRIKAQIEQAVRSSKPKSRVVEFNHLIRKRGKINMGIATRVGGIIRHKNTPPGNQQIEAITRVGVAQRVCGKITHRSAA